MSDPGSALDDTAIRATPRTVPQFSDFAHELLSSVAESGRVAVLDAGQILFHEGDPGDNLYLVLSGHLRISKRLNDGTEVELHRPGPGDSFGELALIDGGARAATVTALTHCRLFSLGRDAFLAALPGSPKLLSAVLRNLVEHVRVTTEHILRGELEQRAIRAEMELEKFRAITQMVAGLAHEINTPIGIVNTAASIVRQRIRSIAAAGSGPDSRRDFDDVREAVDLMTANIQRAHKLIGTFKQLSASQFVDAKEALSLAEVVDDTLGLFAISARQARLDLQVVNALGERAGSWVGYRGILTQVLLNLLTNVERYAYPEGQGGPVEIVIADAPREGKEAAFAIAVRDSGRGIAPQHVPRIFEPFYTTGRGKGATGLGLAIVHNLVTTRLKGVVNVTSELDHGTAITVTVPRTIPD